MCVRARESQARWPPSKVRLERGALCVFWAIEGREIKLIIEERLHAYYSD
jgi:hypothetical protein